jgi:hypothetical protein
VWLHFYSRLLLIDESPVTVEGRGKAAEKRMPRPMMRLGVLLDWLPRRDAAVLRPYKKD